MPRSASRDREPARGRRGRAADASIPYTGSCTAFILAENAEAVCLIRLSRYARANRSAIRGPSADFDRSSMVNGRAAFSCRADQLFRSHDHLGGAAGDRGGPAPGPCADGHSALRVLLVVRADADSDRLAVRPVQPAVV